MNIFFLICTKIAFEQICNCTNILSYFQKSLHQIIVFLNWKKVYLFRDINQYFIYFKLLLSPPFLSPELRGRGLLIIEIPERAGTPSNPLFLLREILNVFTSVKLHLQRKSTKVYPCWEKRLLRAKIQNQDFIFFLFSLYGNRGSNHST